MLLLAMAMFCERVQADIVGGSVHQQMDAQTFDDSDAYVNTSYPLASATVSASSTFFPITFYAEASQTIHPYVGPMFSGDNTPFLSLSVDTHAHIVAPFSGDVGLAYSYFYYSFVLDTAHPYTFNFSGSASPAIGLNFASIQFVGPDGAVASGSGILPAGFYQLASESSAREAGEANHTFSLQVGSVAAVPEAPAWLIWGLATACVVVGTFVRRQLQSRITVTERG